ncbi:uncharacterized protein LOC143272446 isoform X4 [Peromyscus maniculatus bairdii]|uniref:uncharacterized protein LOC143272446 isoform X4 n=1 Tax=Peromyscus maniculatus bairdii TaxID=230844 RepID=UPI003FD4B9BE
MYSQASLNLETDSLAQLPEGGMTEMRRVHEVQGPSYTMQPWAEPVIHARSNLRVVLDITMPERAGGQQMTLEGCRRERKMRARA